VWRLPPLGLSTSDKRHHAAVITGLDIDRHPRVVAIGGISRRFMGYGGARTADQSSTKRDSLSHFAVTAEVEAPFDHV
jgi:hypothetical protein